MGQQTTTYETLPRKIIIFPVATPSGAPTGEYYYSCFWQGAEVAVEYGKDNRWLDISGNI